MTPPLWASGLSLDFGFRSGAGKKSGAGLQGILRSISPAPCRVPDKPWNCEVTAAWEGVLPGALWGLWLCSNLPFLLHAGLKPQAVRWGQGTSLQQPVKALGSPAPAGRERGASAWGKPDQKRLKAKKAEFRADEWRCPGQRRSVFSWRMDPRCLNKLLQSPQREQGPSRLLCYCLPLQEAEGVKGTGTTEEPKNTASHATWPGKSQHLLWTKTCIVVVFRCNFFLHYRIFVSGIYLIIHGI